MNEKVAEILQKHYTENYKIRNKQFEVPVNRRDITWSLEGQYTLGRIQVVRDVAKELGIVLEDLK